MNYFDLSLDALLDLPKWQLLQDNLAKVTKMALVTIDYKGHPITRHSQRSAFCGHIRDQLALSALCEKCDARAGLEAVRHGSAHIYQCHFGIVDIAIPITIQDKYFGALMAGQVRLKHQDDAEPLDVVYNPVKRELIDATLQQRNKEFCALPELSREQIEDVAALLQQIVNYLVSQAVSCANSELIHSNEQAMTPPLHALHNANQQMSNELLEALIDHPSIVKSTSGHPAINQAIQYVHKHKDQKIYIDDVAKACYLSKSYFSRLFKRETGLNFSTYLTKQKIFWAKQLLETTDLAINQISSNLAYSDPGYFIKKFKQVYGMTPAVYKQQYQARLNSHVTHHNYRNIG